MAEQYRIKYMGYTLTVRKQDDGTAEVVYLAHRAVTRDWEASSLLTAAETVILAYEAERTGKMAREKSVMEAQQLAHQRAKAKATLDAASA